MFRDFVKGRVNHGAKAWIGWEDSVKCSCGDNGTVIFFEQMKNKKNVSEGIAAVDALTHVGSTDCNEPDLTVYPTNKGSCKLADYRTDPDETTVANGRDFKLLRMITGTLSFYAKVTFYAAPSFDEFFVYISTDSDAPAEILVKCHPDSYDVYKETTAGSGLNKAIKIDEAGIKKVKESLIKVPANSRPKKRSSLTGFIIALLKGIPKQDIDNIIDILFIKKIVYEENGRIKYSLS